MASSNGLVLLTGVSGFIGPHVLVDLLENGHDVLAVVRNESRAVEIKKIAAKYPARKVEFDFVADMGVKGAFDQVLKNHQDIKYVIHLATPFSGDGAEVVRTTVEGIENLLASSKAHGPKIKRVVYTSSQIVYEDITRTTPIQEVVNEDSVNPLELDSVNISDLHSYAVSKKHADQAFWKFFETEKPHFDALTVAPSLVIGEVLTPVSKLEDLGPSMNLLYQIIAGNLPQGGYTSVIHAKDVAKIHRLALTTKYSGSRWFTALPYEANKTIVEWAGAVKPDESVDAKKELVSRLETPKTDREIGFQLISAEQAIKDSVAFLRSKKLIN